MRYVNLSSPAPAAPFTDWSTAATNIQDAINASAAGDTVLVTNGVYSVGGKVMLGDLTNRITLDKPLTVQSVNGPEVTIIQGLNTTIFVAVRCAWLTNSASLIGFTLQSGGTRGTGDVYAQQSGGGVWCSGTNALVQNCVVTGNSAYQFGGGAYSGTLTGCILSSNSLGLSGSGWGGGMSDSVLNNCKVVGNSAREGGGAYGGTLNNCALIQNYTLAGGGGGAVSSVLNNCTVVSNSVGSTYAGGGTLSCALKNCIVWYNTFDNASPGPGAYSYCDIQPLQSGTGNLALEPQLIGDGVHLSETSPCRGTGNLNFVAGTDIDGQPWNAPPSIGCDEWHPEPVIVSAPGAKPTGKWDQAAVSVLAAGREPFVCRWSKDGAVLPDGSHYSNATTAQLIINQVQPGDAGKYQVIVSNIFGLATNVAAQMAFRCVDAGSTTPASPFTNWSTAATDIQSAIDAAKPNEWILVTNGTYSSGGKRITTGTTNRVAIDKAVIVTSMNGPDSSIIEGRTNSPGYIRCVGMTNGAVLLGFTLRNGAANDYTEGGGGVWCSSTNARLYSCLIVSNSTQAGLSGGGGACSGTLYDCLITRNSGIFGGGAYASSLNNCTVARNSASSGGGVYGSGVLNNCIVYYNTAPGSNSSSNWLTATFVNCCTFPLPAGPYNFTNDPLVVDGVGGNFHLQSVSPCINSGNNLAVGSLADFEGNPRIARGTVDAGAYEVQSAASALSYLWAQQYGFATDGTADTADTDGDGMSNWQEWIAGTDPTNVTSLLKISAISKTPTNAAVTWQSVTNRTYYVLRGTNLGASPSFLTLQKNISGLPGTTRFTDNTASGSGPFFYRIGIQ